MKCPGCGIEFQMKVSRDYIKPLFAILIILLIAFFFIGFQLRGENEALKLKVVRLEKKIAYYESTLLNYQKAIEQFIQKTPEWKK